MAELPSVIIRKRRYSHDVDGKREILYTKEGRTLQMFLLLLHTI